MTYVASKQDIHFIVLFCTVILFNRLNVNNYVLFVCFSVRLQVSFNAFVSDTLARDFLSAQLIYRGKVELCHPTIYGFRGKESKLFFADVGDREN